MKPFFLHFACHNTVDKYHLNNIQMSFKRFLNSHFVFAGISFRFAVIIYLRKIVRSKDLPRICYFFTTNLINGWKHGKTH